MWVKIVRIHLLLNIVRINEGSLTERRSLWERNLRLDQLWLLVKVLRFCLKFVEILHCECRLVLMRGSLKRWYILTWIIWFFMVWIMGHIWLRILNLWVLVSIWNSFCLLIDKPALTHIFPLKWYILLVLKTLFLKIEFDFL